MDCEAHGGEFRVAGPPGCGKTTWLSGQIERAAQKYGSESVFVASFTKAAAVELISRNLPIKNQSVGTLHSHCFRAIGDPEIAEVHIKDFNEQFPHYALTPSGNQSKIDEASADIAANETDTDSLFSQYNILRNKMVSRDNWPPAVEKFAQAWESFKSGNELLDFTDLIETAYRDVSYPLDCPTIGFIDECQDLTPLQFALVRKWGQTMDYFILVGDADQLLYDFTGATVEPFLTPLPEGHKITLKKSYRVPIKPHQVALQWIRKCSQREDVEYYPTDVEGSVGHNKGTYASPSAVLDAAEQDLANGMSVMLLGNCSYQLKPVVEQLRKRGLPFHNPYRTSRGDWNPIMRRRGWTAADRLLAYLEPTGPAYGGPAYGPIARMWTPAQLNAWTELCSVSGLMHRGAREIIKQAMGSDNAMTEDDAINLLIEVFTGDMAQEALRLDPHWLESRLLSAARKRLEFPIQIMKTRGRDALRDTPRVIVGTVHSVKGGEADCHPAGQPILTTNGYVAIEDLDPQVHRLVAFNLRNSKICRGTRKRSNGANGYHFTKGSRPYSGRVLTLEHENHKTTVTMNHHMLVRFNEKFFEESNGGYVSYVMKKGDWYRVGITKVRYTGHGGAFIFGPTNRLHVEDGDAIWLIGHHKTLDEALIDEDYVSYFYGIPQTTFKSSNDGVKRRNVPQERIDAVFNKLQHVLKDRASKLLEDRGMDIRYPLIDISDQDNRRMVRTGKDYSFVTYAANFMPGLMKVPVDNGGKTAEWVTPRASYSTYEGMVYSLEVLPTHYYIAGGVVVHNCVYYFPDFSYASWKNMLAGDAGKDALRRQAYVAFTRCRHKLTLCAPATQYHMGRL